MSSLYKWPEEKQCAVVLSFDFDVHTPYLWRNRKAQTNSLGELEQRRFGVRQGICRILELLAHYDVKASFFVPGLVAEQYPQAVAEVAEHGHEIGLHGYIHERLDELNKGEAEETMLKSVEALERIVGRKRMGYRSPSWEMTADMFDLLNRYDVLYDSSLMGYDHPYWVDGLPELPVQWLLDDAVFYRYTGSGIDIGPPQSPAVVVDMWNRELEGMKQFGGLFMVTMHPWITGRAARLLALEELIKSISDSSAVWWSTCDEVALYHRAAYADQYLETSSSI